MSMPLVKVGKHRINVFNVTHVTEAEPEQRPLVDENDQDVEKRVVIHHTSGVKITLKGEEGEAFLNWYDDAATDITPRPEEPEEDGDSREERPTLDLGE